MKIQIGAMWVTLNSTTLNGAIVNGNVAMDVGSKWIATADSTVIFITDVYPAQIDALAGVTIKAEGACAGEYDLASGGEIDYRSLVRRFSGKKVN